MSALGWVCWKWRNLRGSERATSAPLGNAAVKQKTMAMGFKFQLPTTRPGRCWSICTAGSLASASPAVRSAALCPSIVAVVRLARQWHGSGTDEKFHAGQVRSGSVSLFGSCRPYSRMKTTPWFERTISFSAESRTSWFLLPLKWLLMLTGS